MNTNQDYDGEAREDEEHNITIIPLDRTSKQDKPDQESSDQEAATNERPRLSLDELEVEERPARQGNSSEIRIMRSSGLTAPKKRSRTGEIRMGTRAQWAETIKQHASTLMAHHKCVALSASEVLVALKAHDLMVEDIEHANGIGDALGACGLRLPVVVGAGPKHYYIPAAGMSPKERAEFDAMPVLDKVRLIRQGNEALKCDNS